MSLTYPIVCKKNDGKYYIDFYLNKKRYRLFNAKKIGIDYKPNNYPFKRNFIFFITKFIAGESIKFINRVSS